MRSLTTIATRSMPMVACFSVCCAISSFVPTPSVPATSTGSLNPAAAVSKSPPKPPIEPITPARLVLFAIGLILSTSALPSSMSTPAALYDSAPPLLPAAAAGAAVAASARTSSATLAMAATSAGPSSACTRALRPSGVSAGSTAHRRWTTISPASTTASTMWTVQPLSLSPAASTAVWTSRSMPPANLGSSDGWMLRARRRQRAQNAAERMRMKPTRSTTSQPAASRCDVSSASYASRERPATAT
mmetsp:Transcript_6645/g.17403  ORF Transcript_6645/g.17403 Transcript_6645/m.17403 type:complete len:246 (-) Transcript_6645:486-1223(-)